MKSLNFPKGQLISKWFFGVIDFLQKMNEQIRLTTMTTCFRSFFGRHPRHQKSFRNYLTFKGVSFFH